MSIQDYKQPYFYHFSRDSIDFANFLLQKFPKKKFNKVLEVCAGSGVIGIELCLKGCDIDEIYFNEIQAGFLESLKENLRKFIPSKKSDIFHCDFESLSLSEKYNLVICNPPFFLEGQARASKDQFKKICHFMSDEKMRALFNLLFHFRREGAEVFFLGRPDQLFITELLEKSQIQLEFHLGKTSIYSIR